MVHLHHYLEVGPDLETCCGAWTIFPYSLTYFLRERNRELRPGETARPRVELGQARATDWTAQQVGTPRRSPRTRSVMGSKARRAQPVPFAPWAAGPRTGGPAG